MAQALKEDGWLFASHTWGHVGLGEGSTTFEQFKADTDKWEERVEPLIGETDTLIYAFGGDIGGVEPYQGERFEYLKSKDALSQSVWIPLSTGCRWERIMCGRPEEILTATGCTTIRIC